MPRPKRVDYPGAWHHITNRGIAKRAIFERRADVRFFLSRLAHAVRRGDMEVHAYCLLLTHFHLFARSPAGRISDAMRRIQSEFAQHFNRRRGRDGGLYRGRFFSSLVKTTSYKDNLIRYIDGNAVKAGVAALPHWHPSSSAYWYARETGPPWLERSWTEARAAERCGASTFRREHYHQAFAPRLTSSSVEWIEGRLNRGEGPVDPLDDLIAAAPGKVRAWLRENALRADGTVRSLPLAPWEDVEAACSAATVPAGAMSADRRWGCNAEIVRVGLLRDLAGLTHARIAAIIRCRRSTVADRICRHHGLLREDPRYANVAADITYRSLRNVR